MRPEKPAPFTTFSPPPSPSPRASNPMRPHAHRTAAHARPRITISVSTSPLRRQTDLELCAHPLGDRAVFAIAEHDMVDNRDAEQHPRRAQPARELDVLATWRRIARRVVVDQHAAGGGHAHEWAEHFARVDFDRVHTAARDLHDIEQAVAYVDADDDEHLLLQAGDARADDARDVFGVRDQRAMAFACERAAAELECG